MENYQIEIKSKINDIEHVDELCMKVFIVFYLMSDDFKAREYFMTYLIGKYNVQTNEIQNIDVYNDGKQIFSFYSLPIIECINVDGTNLYELVLN